MVSRLMFLRALLRCILDSQTICDNDSENNKDQPIKGGPIGISSIGVKSPCNGPVFDHP